MRSSELFDRLRTSIVQCFGAAGTGLSRNLDETGELLSRLVPELHTVGLDVDSRVLLKSYENAQRDIEQLVLTLDRPVRLHGPTNARIGVGPNGETCVVKPWIDFGYSSAPGPVAEVAAGRLGALIRAGIPLTCFVEGDPRKGSAQIFVPHSRVRPYRQRKSPFRRDQEEAAALVDLVGANSDRHIGNLGKKHDGGLALFDNARMFGESPDIIYSPFTYDLIGVPFSRETLDILEQISLDDVHEAIDVGLSQKSIDSAMHRFSTVKSAGIIARDESAFPRIVRPW